MYIHLFLASLAMTTTLTLTACSSSDDPQPTGGTQLNPNGEQMVDDGQGGGDTTAIAGLWDGSITEGETTDVIYWSLTTDGVLTRYDYQQDGAAGASGENCYITGDPISVSPEDGDSYSFFNVATTAIVAEDTLTITFVDADINDLDADGDTTEIPTLSWTMLDTPLLEDLNACTEDEETDQTDSTADTDASGSSEDTDAGTDTGTDADADASETDPAVAGDGEQTGDNGNADIPFDSTGGLRPLMTRAECETIGGSIIGDIGDGAIHRPEYRCESGESPVARITYLEGEPIAADGEVCCL